MVQKQSCLISLLGLPEYESRLIKSIIKHTDTIAHARYEWTDDLEAAHLVMLNGDNEEAKKAWYELAKKPPAPVMLLITAKGQNSTVEYSASRPFSPAKMIDLLDKIYTEKLDSILQAQVFSSDGKSARHNAPPVQNVVAKEFASVGVFPTVRRALVVDDSPTVRKQLELELRSFKFQVDIAETGEECLSMLNTNHYNVIFLDVVMPGTDGYEVCRIIKKNKLFKDTPVIMLTSKSSSFDRVRGALAGCNSYLTKPVDYEKFHAVLDMYVT